MTRVGVLGAGSWGTTLADLLARQGHDVTIWAHEAEVVHQINREHANNVFLPTCALAPALKASEDLLAVAGAAELILSAAPSHAVRSVLGRAGPAIRPGVVVVSATKGIETGTL